MGKSKRKARKHSNHHDNSQKKKPLIQRRQHSQSTRASNPSAQIKKRHNQQPNRPKIPFDQNDNILLVGEGDLSFSLSLARHHKPANIVATCYDNEMTLQEKHPQIGKTISALGGASAVTDISTTEPVWNGFSPPGSPSSVDDVIDEDVYDHYTSSCHVHFGVDATKLSSLHKKLLRPFSPFSKIVFNFPHVGGLSTDVNRQVRANQQLLVGFFDAAKPLLCSVNNPIKFKDRGRGTIDQDADTQHDYENDIDRDQRIVSTSSGQILVTLFEGEPYTLWNVRDLARHSGLRVVESFKFPWSAYPGYRHARTLGNIVSDKDNSANGHAKGGWRGEDRDARCYIFEKQDETNVGIRKYAKQSADGQDEEED